MKRTIFSAAIALGIVGGCALLSVLLFGGAGSPQERHLTITTRKYAYDPPTFRVNRGDRVHIRLSSQDVVHGFYLEGYDLDAKVTPQSPYMELHRPSGDHGAPPERLEEIVFVANREGKFRYRCSNTCGYLHPFMNGEMVVAPNRPYHAGIGMAVGMVLAMFVLYRRPEDEGKKGI